MLILRERLTWDEERCAGGRISAVDIHMASVGLLDDRSDAAVLKHKLLAYDASVPDTGSDDLLELVSRPTTVVPF